MPHAAFNGREKLTDFEKPCKEIFAAGIYRPRLGCLMLLKTIVKKNSLLGHLLHFLESLAILYNCT
jgi:hypothetical protein